MLLGNFDDYLEWHYLNLLKNTDLKHVLKTGAGGGYVRKTCILNLEYERNYIQLILCCPLEMA